MTIVIAKNPGGSDLGIEDLGLVVEAGGERILTDLFSLGAITESEDLRTRVSAAQIVINDGISDLSIPEALSQLDILTEFEGSEISGGIDIDDILTTVSAESVVNNSGNLVQK